MCFFGAVVVAGQGVWLVSIQYFNIRDPFGIYLLIINFILIIDSISRIGKHN